jgi:hypothetical protein
VGVERLRPVSITTGGDRSVPGAQCRCRSPEMRRLGWGTSPYLLLSKLEGEGPKNFVGMIEFIAVSPGKPKKQCFFST